jgi:hypothetical protein
VSERLALSIPEAAERLGEWAGHFERDNDREGAAMVRDCAAAIRKGE